MPGHPDGEAGVAVEDQLAAGEVADELVPQRHQLVLGEEPHQTIGDDDGWPAGGDGVQPGLLGDVGADDVRVGALWEQALSSGGNLGEVDVVPVHGGRRGQAEHPGVQPCAQVNPDRVRVPGQELRGHLV